MKYTPAKIILIVSIAVQALFLSACASGVSRTSGFAAPAQVAEEREKIRRITVEITPKVQNKLKDSLKFSTKELRDRVELALVGRAMFQEDANASAATLRITVDHVRVRSTFNAVMWGAMSGNDSIKGEITLSDSAGKVIDKFRVSASYALGGWGGGQDQMRMGWLYEAFTKELIKELTAAGAAGAKRAPSIAAK